MLFIFNWEIVKVMLEEYCYFSHLYLSVHKTMDTVKHLKIQKKKYCKYHKISLIWIFYGVMYPNDADGMATSVDLDQTAPLI